MPCYAKQGETTMNTILILLIFSISLFVAFFLGRWTNDTIPEKDRVMLKAIKAKLTPREKTTFHSPSEKAKAKRDMENITE